MFFYLQNYTGCGLQFLLSFFCFYFPTKLSLTVHFLHTGTDSTECIQGLFVNEKKNPNVRMVMIWSRYPILQRTNFSFFLAAGHHRRGGKGKNIPTGNNTGETPGPGVTPKHEHPRPERIRGTVC